MIRQGSRALLERLPDPAGVPRDCFLALLEALGSIGVELDAIVDTVADEPAIANVGNPSIITCTSGVLRTIMVLAS